MQDGFKQVAIADRRREKNYEVTSKNMKSINVNELNDEQKSKLIDSHRQQLLQEVQYIGKTSI